MRPFRMHEIFELAAGAYLCEDLPAGWPEMTDEQLAEFASDNAWHPLEFLDGLELLANIQSSADVIEQVLREHGVEVVE